jgi:glycine cleavage system pyridoxal-binding protein P
VHGLTATLAAGLADLGHASRTARSSTRCACGFAGRKRAATVLAAALRAGINLRDRRRHAVGVALDETLDGLADLRDAAGGFGGRPGPRSWPRGAIEVGGAGALARTGAT